MSFQDLERGLERTPLNRDIGISPEADLQFQAVRRAVLLQTHKINANVSAITKLVDLLGSPKDTSDLRSKLHNLTDVTREVIKQSTGDVKRFASWDLLPGDRQHAQEKQRGSADFQKALASFQDASRKSAERQRLFVERAKATMGSEYALQPSSLSGDQDDGTGQLLELAEQRQATMDAIPDSEVEFQEQLIQEREGEIEQIEQGITELNQIFGDLATIVGDQQNSVDAMYDNVFSVVRDTEASVGELRQAAVSQRKAGRRMFCLFLVFIVVLSIVLLAVLS